MQGQWPLRVLRPWIQTSLRPLSSSHRALLRAQASLPTEPCDNLLRPPKLSPILSPRRHGLSYYWETSPPTDHLLRQAEKFFQVQHKAQLLYSTSLFRAVQATTAPEVAFLGRSNVGKSSLLNALLGCTRHKLCHTSSKPGRTQSMNFFALTDVAAGPRASKPDAKIILVDMPGYGRASREEWGKEIMKYLAGRKQLKRAFLLVDATAGIKSSDELVLQMLRAHGVSHQVILSKVDKFLGSSGETAAGQLERLDSLVVEIKKVIQPREKEGPEALGELISSSAHKAKFMLQSGSGIDLRPGINDARRAVLNATGYV